jgi:hypothetical protein
MVVNALKSCTRLHKAAASAGLRHLPAIASLLSLAGYCDVDQALRGLVGSYAAAQGGAVPAATQAAAACILGELQRLRAAPPRCAAPLRAPPTSPRRGPQPPSVPPLYAPTCAAQTGAVEEHARAQCQPLRCPAADLAWRQAECSSVPLTSPAPAAPGSACGPANGVQPAARSKVRARHSQAAAAGGASAVAVSTGADQRGLSLLAEAACALDGAVPPAPAA